MFLCINVYAEKIEVEYKKCVDGDTAWFIMNKEEVKVRFIAINAPELEHEETKAEYYSEEAKDQVCTKLERATKIELEFDPNSDKQDKYERYLAWVFVDNKLLQNDIVKNENRTPDYATQEVVQCPFPRTVSRSQRSQRRQIHTQGIQKIQL